MHDFRAIATLTNILYLGKRSFPVNSNSDKCFNDYNKLPVTDSNLYAYHITSNNSIFPFKNKCQIYLTSCASKNSSKHLDRTSCKPQKVLICQNDRYRHKLQRHAPNNK
jgi:hypothetical protein